MAPNGPVTEEGLVQLLTPAGQRTAHPDYDARVAHLDADALRGLYRDMVLTRRFDDEATALQRQGELALCAPCLGQEAAQVGSGLRARAAGLRVPVLPRARRRVHARRRPAAPAAALPRHRARRLGPREAQLPPLHARHRLAHAARHRLRDGPPARRRRRHAATPTRDAAVVALLRRRRHLAGRRQRGARLRGREQRPGRVLLPEQPVGDLRADRRASRRVPARATAARASASRACASTATTCSPCYAVTARRSSAPATAAAPRSSRRSPTGWARTPPPTTRRRYRCRARGGALASARPDRTASRTHLEERGELPADFVDDARGRGRRRSASACAPTSRSLAAPAGGRRCSTTSTRRRTRSSSPSGPGSSTTRRRSWTPASPARGATDRTSPCRRRSTTGVQTLTMAKAINLGLRRAMERDPKVLLMGEDIGALGGVFRVTDGAAEGLRRRPRGRHAARRVRHRRHRDRPGAARLPPGLRDPVRRLHLPGVRPDHHASSPRCTTARGGRLSAARRHPRALRRRHRRGRAPQRVARGALRPHRRACASSRPSTPGRRVRDDPAGHRVARTRCCSSSPRRRYWDKGDVVDRRRRRCSDPARAGAATPRTARVVATGHRRHARRLRADRPARRSRPPRSPSAEGDERRGRSTCARISPLDADDGGGVASRRPAAASSSTRRPSFFGAGAEVAAARHRASASTHLQAPVLRVGGFHTPYPVAKIEHEYLPEPGPGARRRRPRRLLSGRSTDAEETDAHVSAVPAPRRR